MIVSCPSCAARYDLPRSRLDGGSAMMRCISCGHSWIESRALEIVDVQPRTRGLPAVIDHDEEPDREVLRLIEAAREAREEFAAARRRRLASYRDWSAFAACLMVPLALVFLLPETVVKAVPAAVQLYRAAGIAVNIYGLEVRNLERQHLIDGGTRVIAVKGDIVNISGDVRKIPALRFGLRDEAGKEVYSWLLTATARPLRAGEATGFVTRVAAPPEGVRELEIRFARAGEIGSNAAP